MKESIIMLPAVPAGGNKRVSRTTDSHRKDVAADRSESDGALFARHLDGDHQALMTLFERHNERLWLYVAKMIGDGTAASDVMQDLWERIIRLREKRSEAPDQPVGYLFRTARNLSLNVVRSRKSSVTIERLAETEHPTTEIAEPTEREELLTMALKELPEAHREILVLNAWSGYDFDEIAGMLGKQRGAIHTTAWRARKKLAEIMERLGRGDRGEEEMF